MDLASRVYQSIRAGVKGINSATLSGAIDVIVVQQEDGSYLTSPFHVRFGKLSVLHSSEKVVDIEINGQPVDIHMKLGENGEAYFVGGEEAGVPLPTVPEAGVSHPSVAEVVLARRDGAGYGRSDEEYRSQDSGFEAEEACPDQRRRAEAEELCQRRRAEVGPAKDASSDEKHETDASLSSEKLAEATAKAPACRNKRRKKMRKDTRRPAVTVPTDGRPNQQEEARPRTTSGGSAGKKASSHSSSSDVSEGGGGDGVFTMDDLQSAEEPKTPLAPPPAASTPVKPASPPSSTPVQPCSPPDCPPDPRSSTGPWSDNDVSDPQTPPNSRSHTPIKSDTEFELERHRHQFEELKKARDWRWQWGQMPTPPLESPPQAALPAPAQDALPREEEAVKQEATGVLSKVLSYMSSAKKGSRPVDGRYLADLDALDPKEAALYYGVLPDDALYQGAAPDDDAESGRGVSLPQSPQEPCVLDNPVARNLFGDSPTPPAFAQLSLCGRLQELRDGAVPDSLFQQSLVSYDDFVCDPSGLLASPDLVLRVEGRYLNWTSAAPVLLTPLLYGRGLPEAACQALEVACVPREVRNRTSSKGRTWFGWRWDAGKDEAGAAGVADKEAGAAEKAEGGADKEAGVAINAEERTDKLDTSVADSEAAPVFEEVVSTATASVTAAANATDVTDAASEVQKPLESVCLTTDTEITTDSESVDHDNVASATDSITLSVDCLQDTQVESSTEAVSTTQISSAQVQVCDADSTSSEVESSAESAVAIEGLVDRMKELSFNADADTTAVVCDTSDAACEDADCVCECADTSTGTSTDTTSADVAADTAGDVAPVCEKEKEPKDADSEKYTDTVTEVPEEKESSTPAEEKVTATATAVEGSRSLRLTTQQVKQLNLNAGCNEAQFSVTTAYQGTTVCRCRVFLWKYDEKVIVSDIDGTITKSDVIGHILPLIGKHWAQCGVTQLFTKIHRNGYNFLYLSARAIGQSTVTREYLESVRQEDATLPDGPMLLNPTGLVNALHREVIEKKPEEFKIPCLKDIKALFPGVENPFYAGYGNRLNDSRSYAAVGIPNCRCFTINPKGELTHELTTTFQSSYNNLSSLVDHMFPPYSAGMLHSGEFSNPRFWRPPMPDCKSQIDQVLGRTKLDLGS